MSDVFAVSLKSFNEDAKGAILKASLSSSNSSLSMSEDISGGITGLLSLLTIIGTSLSIVSVVLAFITYSLFSDLRSLSGTALLNLLATLFLSHLVLVVGIERTADKDLCLVVAFLLHYLWLSVICWLFVMFKDMHDTFKSNINLRPSPAAEKSQPFVKCVFFAWGLPAVSTASAFILRNYTNWDEINLTLPTCWLLGKGSLVLTFCIPFGILVFLEIRYFVKSAVFIRCTACFQVTKKVSDKMKKRRYLQLFLYSKIAVLMFVTWTCCLVSQFALSIAFWIAFTVLISLQGFVISLVYCCNSKVFRLYSRTLRTSSSRTRFGHENYGSSELSHLTSFALISWQPTPDIV